jgi:FlaA1/EpsC-like NDP-sugar epimerase
MQLKLSNFAPKGTRSYYRRVLKYGLVDLGIIFIAYAAAISFWDLTLTGESPSSVWMYTLGFAVVNLLSMYFSGVYQRIWQRTSGHGVTVIVQAVLIATAILIPIDLFAPNRLFPVRILLFAQVLMLGGFIAIRYRSRLINSVGWRWNAVVRRQFPTKRTRVLIVGAGESGQALAWRLMHRFSKNDYRVIGFIDDDPDKQHMYVEGCPILGTHQSIERIAEEHQIDLIVVAIHHINGPDFREILTACENTKALIKVVPDLEALVNAHHSTTLLRDVQAEDLIGRTAITRHEAVDLSPITNKLILVTGAAGSIGSELSRQMMQYAPTRAILLDNNESGLHDLITELRSKYPDVDLVPALVDITQRDTLRTVFEKHHPQIVFHAGAYKHVPMLEYYPHEALRVNIGGTRNVAELAKEFGVERFVLISTDKAVNPSSIMGATKRVCELMVHALAQREDNHTLFASVRFGNVLGSRGSVVPTFNRQIDSGGPVTVTHPEMTRYFMSIPEAVNLIIHAACMTSGDDIYVLSMGEVVRIVELAERMIRLRGLRPYKDIEIKFSGIRPGEKMHEELFHGEEKPLATLHPSISKVNTWNERFNWSVFWARVDALAQDLPENPPNFIDRLRETIKPEKYAPEVEASSENIQVAHQ